MAQNWRKRMKGLLPYLFLVAFGLAYDHWVDRLEEDGTDDGFTADLVVGGTAVTLIAMVPVIGKRSILKILLAFVASGAPMWLGSRLRWKRRNRFSRMLMGETWDRELREKERDPNAREPWVTTWLRGVIKALSISS